MSESRRSFLKRMGASLALGGLASCEGPKDKIVPYFRQPEDVLPGKTTYYATTMELDGAAIGLLVESHEGRPTKVEGNPAHPQSLGATGLFEQASVLDLYDPSRARGISEDGAPRSFRHFQQRVMREIAPDGFGTWILLERTTSPTIEAQVTALRNKYPRIGIAWRGTNRAWEGSRAAFGRIVEPRFDLARAHSFCAVGADVLAGHPKNVRIARQIIDRRRNPRVSLPRLSSIETNVTVTGITADTRIALRPDELPIFAAMLLYEIAGGKGRIPANDEAKKVARDLREGGVVFVGNHVRAHAIAHAIHSLIGAPVTYGPSPIVEAGTHDERELHDAIARGEVKSLFVLAHDLESIPSVPFSVHLSPYATERTAFHVAETHYLERWGDARAPDGTISFVQPLVTPLFGGLSTIEILEMILGEPNPNARAIVRARWKDLDDEAWQHALARGFLEGSAPNDEHVTIDWGGVEREVEQAKRTESFVMNVVPDVKLHDGRFAKNAWLQELPHPITKLTWTSAVEMAPETAKELDLEDGDVVRVGDFEAPIITVAGHAQRCATFFKNGTIHKTGRKERLAITQRHQIEAGREIVRRATLEEYERDPEFAKDEHPKPLLYFLAPDGKHQWAMSIDLLACTGCSTCVIACQAENNIPTVGKEGVLRRREMHWLRIDVYAEGDRREVQPMLCQHCEMAPCEYVCPVAATTHSSDGLNQMVYSRCVGTRFCSNNCPYKVRRFNYFNYTRDAYTGVRELVFNPDVSVRDRGVMEKCTFCVQRIREAERNARYEHRDLRKGEVITACAQACPTRAIQFGTLEELRPSREHERSYALLDEDLGTRPRVTYLARIRNPA